MVSPLLLVGFLCLGALLIIPQVVHATMEGTKFANATVWGAMIMTDPKIAHLMGNQDLHIQNIKKHNKADMHKTQAKADIHVNNIKTKSADLRKLHAEETMKLLPFPVVSWPSMYVQDCPGRKRYIPRGCDVSHYQIWADWEYQGRLGSYKAMASDSDLLVVFEDDAAITVKNITQSLEQELSPRNMHSDLILLGWCFESDNVHEMPLCAHAYAVTRAGVKKILSAWNICSSEGVDADLRKMNMLGVFSWQKARPESYSDRLEEFVNYNGQFNGMFVQKKGVVSLNHGGKN